MALNHQQLVNNLYGRLKPSQANDVCVPARTLMEIRYLLKNTRYCSQVLVEADMRSYDGLTNYPVNIPRFISSQLEIQDITDWSSCFAQISAILDIVSEYIARDPKQIPSDPILFFWHGPTTQRTYCLFAFLACSMDSRSYSVSELLKLRDLSVPQATLETLMEDPEIGDIFKGKSGAMPTTTQHSRRLKRAKDVSSSADSEEILYQGKKQACEDGGDGQWKYRGRTGSEVTSSEPLSAPTGLAAQQSEGFQRFFKAVASPTHVRVTAGGRIVPNTRGSASPTAKWDKDRAGQEGRGMAETAREGQAEAMASTSGQVAPSHMMPPVFPGHPAYFHHMGLPMPLYPMPAGFPWGYGIPPGHVPAPSMSHPMPAQSQQGAMGAPTQGKPEDNGTQKPNQGPIKISPPDQFDQGRPFIFNGQVYSSSMAGGPPQMGPLIPSPYLPHGVPTHPAFAQGRFQPMHHPFSAMPVLNSAGFQPASVGGSSQTMHPPSGPKSVATPPITSIKPSEITKRQLDSLRSSLRYYEDQLQYNKHQIDEKGTREQAQKIKENIELFEGNYKMQLNFEATNYPKSDQSTDTIIAETRPCKTPSRPSSMAGNRTMRSQRGSMESAGRPTFRYPKSMERGGRRQFNRLAVGINSSKSNTHQAQVALEALEAHILSKLDDSDPLKKADAALVRGAALAPPFRPGPNATFPLPPSEYSPSTGLTAAGESHNARQSSAVAEYNQGQWQPAPHAQNQQRGSWETMQSASTYFTNDSTTVEGQLSPEHPGQGGFSGSPYLVGKLPQGMNSYNAHGTDYLYSRELTEEEKRARHIYWGGVSSKGLGLPKFDGKDFYAPSPAKLGGSAELSNPVAVRGVPIGCAEANSNLASRPAENDPFRPVRDANSIRSREGGQKFSKAIPIVAPPDAGRGDTPKANAKTSTTTSQANNNADDLNKALKDCKLSPSNQASVEVANDKKATPAGRRALERSSNKSGHDLWQTMLKKGSTSGNVLPSAVSSTTATGYLPPYFGHAAASLGPAISNPNGSPARGSPNGSNKPVEMDAVQGPAEKVGENCPPGDAHSADFDATKDLHERMLRDAERRGVIGSDWQ